MLTRPYFRRYLAPSAADEFLVLLASEGVLVPISVPVHGVATQPEDDLVLATAVSARAEYLVTGDTRFIERVRTYEGVTLISPRNFVMMLDSLPG